MATVIRRDSTWSWLVCFAVFTAMYLETGLVKSLGVLLPELKEQFSSKIWMIGLAISAVPGFGAITCILATGLSKVLSHRSTVMLFGSLASIGLILGSMATSVATLAISFVVTGCFYGAQAVAFAVLPVYFDKYYDAANGIAHAGGAAGVICMPLISQFLLHLYGWRGTTLILGALTALVVVSGAVLRPTEGSKVRDQVSEDVKDVRDVERCASLGDADKQFFKHSSDHLDKLHNYSAGNNRATSEVQMEMTDDQTKSIKSLHANNNKDKKRQVIDEKHLRSHLAGALNRFSEYCVRTFDLQLFLNYDFVALALISTATGYYFTGWLIYLVPHADQLGYSPYASSALATAGGVGNLFGSCVFPLLAKVLATRPMIVVANVTAFVSLALDPVMAALQSYIGLVLASFFLNIGNAVWGCCVCKELCAVVHDDVYTNALNWTYVGYALGSLCSGFLSGWLFDKYGNYTASFLFLSIMPLFSLTPMLLSMFKSLITIRREDCDRQYLPVARNER